MVSLIGGYVQGSASVFYKNRKIHLLYSKVRISPKVEIDATNQNSLAWQSRVKVQHPVIRAGMCCDGADVS